MCRAARPPSEHALDPRRQGVRRGRTSSNAGARQQNPGREERRFPTTLTWFWPHLRVRTLPAGGPGGHCRYTQTGVPSPTRQGRRRSGAATTDHGPGPPRTGHEPPRAGSGPLQVEAGPPGGLSHQASQAQASGPPLPARAGVRSRHVPLWARPPTPGSGAATYPTGTSLLPEASPPATLNDGG